MNIEYDIAWLQRYSKQFNKSDSYVKKHIYALALVSALQSCLNDVANIVKALEVHACKESKEEIHLIINP